MVKRVAINGFGRIGRMALRALIERHAENSDITIVAINDLAAPDHSAHLLKYDSIHGPLNHPVKIENDHLVIGNRAPIKMLKESSPENLPWSDLGIDIVLECSGRFTKKPEASKHLNAGAKKVIISAPAENPDITVVFGVNHKTIQSTHQIISNASCTTNCLAPLAFVLHNSIGIVNGYMTTIHSYTGDQRLIDTDHADLRRARAANLSMIPSTTGAARAVGEVLPDLKGKLDGTSIRVPTSNVSVVDFCFISKRNTSVQEINSILQKASETHLKGVLAVTDEPLVSVDFNHNPHSSILDMPQTQVIDGTFCRVLSWYDNEWGFSNRLIDLIDYITV